MHRNNEYSLKEALKSLLSTYKLDSKFYEAAIRDSWPEMMGNTIARHTSNLKLVNGKLQLFITSAPLKQDLMFNKEKIIERINETLGEHIVKDVEIK